MAIVRSILLASIKGLGKIGDIVNVKRGYFRYLEGLSKVCYATEEALVRLEENREMLKRKDEERKQEAEVWAERLQEKTLKIISEAGEKGILYGSISARDIVKILNEQNINVRSDQISLDKQPVSIKELGTYTLTVELHPQVISDVQVIIESTAKHHA